MKLTRFFLALLLVLWVVTSCSNEAMIKHFKVVEHDGCEYITYGLGLSNGVMAHKGNCKNPIHRCR